MNPIGLILFALAPITGPGFLTIPPSTESVASTEGYSGLFANESLCNESTGLPEHRLSRELLPDVTIEQKPRWQHLNRVAWHLFFHNLQPASCHSSALSSARLSSQFSQNEFFWDQAWINIGIGNYAHRVFDTLGGLNIFYQLQHSDGFIPREIQPNGNEMRFVPAWKLPLGNLNDRGSRRNNLKRLPADIRKRIEALKSLYGRENNNNPPLAAHAEWQHYLMHRDKNRLAKVIQTLEWQTHWLEQNRRVHHGELTGLFWQRTMGSGMDNAPATRDLWGEAVAMAFAFTGGQNATLIPFDINKALHDKKDASFDMSAQMKLHYDTMALIEIELHKPEQAESYQQASRELSSKINECMWDNTQDFYFNVYETCDNKDNVFLLSGYWALYSGIASIKQAQAMLKHLQDSDRFKTPMPFPSLSVNHPAFEWQGNYWRGGVWPPMMFISLKGLMNYAQAIPEAWQIAIDASADYLDGLANTVFGDQAVNELPEDTSAYWQKLYEYNRPDNGGPGERTDAKGDDAKPRSAFLGWGGLGPIGLMQEVALGIHIGHKEVIWFQHRSDSHGVMNLPIGKGFLHLSYSTDDDLENPFKIHCSQCTELQQTGIHSIKVIPYKASSKNFELSIEQVTNQPRSSE